MPRYAPVNFADVALEGAFWKERLETVLARTVPSQHRQLEENGILESLTLPTPVPPVRIPNNRHNFTTQIFWDSDVGKWIEAASYALAHRRDSDIEAKIDEVGNLLERGQLSDGYLNFWYIGREPGRRWTNLRDNHELYCAGHLLEGALAYYQITGRRQILDVMLRYIDHIVSVFGPASGQRKGYCGHQEIELALIKLYRETRDRKHLDLAAYFINQRGAQPHYFDEEAIARGEDPKDFWARTYQYNQSHKPVRQQDKVVGHAVRAMYMYAAMADLAVELDDDELRRACEVLWQDVTTTKMYVTGGLGSSANNEGFTADYDLPNDTAYAETCAAVALIFWAQRMLHLDLDGRYADVLEQSLYNGALAGLSRDGEHYFYENRLESDGSHERWTWHHCPCCTMNVARLIASIGSYFYSASEDGFAIHLYGGTSVTTKVAGHDVTVREQSDYPWSGRISLEIQPVQPVIFTLKLRIPGWTLNAQARVNGKAVKLEGNLDRGYLSVRRSWQAGDVVELDLPMPPERIYAHPRIRGNAGQVALRRGPLVYCIEQADNPGASLNAIRLPRPAELAAHLRAELFDGIITLVADGMIATTGDWGDQLYRDQPPRLERLKITAIPFYLWCNRGPGPMRVWLPEA